MAELRPGQYQGGLKMLIAAEAALQQAIASVRKQEDSASMRRRIDEVQTFIKKAKSELKLG